MTTFVLSPAADGVAGRVFTTNQTIMGNKIIDVIKALAFAVFAVILVLMMIQDFQDGLVTWGDKGFFLLYVALFLYALWRVFGIVKNMFSKL